MNLSNDSLGGSLTSIGIERDWTNVPEQDKAFAVEYVTNGFKHLDAAQAVGLSRSSGLRKLRDPLIGAFIGYLQENANQAKLITQQFVEQQYIEVLPMLKGEIEVPIHDLKSGETTNAKKFHSAEVVSVLRDLGKSSGYIQPEFGPSAATVNVQINLADLAGDIVIEHDEVSDERERDDK